MSLLGGITHVYHVWALFGLLTAILYVPAAYEQWRVNGGTWSSAPKEVSEIVWREALGSIKDFAGIFRWILAGFTSPSLYFQGPIASKYPKNHTLLLGIAIGGLARFITGLYWGETNTNWMEEDLLLMPAIPIVLFIYADHQHHRTAWPDKPWQARIFSTLAIGWIIIGAFAYPIF